MIRPRIHERPPRSYRRSVRIRSGSSPRCSPSMRRRRGGRDRRDLIEGNVASSRRQNSEDSQDSDAGYAEAGCGGDGKNDGCGGGPTFGKAMAAKPTGSCKSPSRPARLPTGQAQRARDQLRIGCHVMPFPPHSCMNRYQSGNSGPAANLGRSKEQSASHVVSVPSHHHADKARVTAWKRRTPVRQRNLKNCAVVCNETLGFWFSPHFSARRVSQFHRSSGDEYSSLSPSASRDAIAFDVGSLWEFRRQETLATESVGAAAVPRREALIMAALTSFLYRSHKISL